MDDWNALLDSPIQEEFDPTWPFNFKWGYNAKTNDVHVWRVQGGTDGRPAHRAELTALWGREPKVAEGDVLGLATYIPSERKLDGTVVAPAEVQVQSYYEKPVPQGVYDWFEEHFPDAVARQAQISRPRLGASIWDDIQQPDASKMRVLKWAWNRGDGTLLWEPDDMGLPTHAMKIMSQWGRPEGAQDFVGFAVWEPGKVEMEDYNTGNPAPPQAHQVVKQELAKMFPHDEITLPDVPQHEFGGNPQILGRRMSAAEWAQTTLAVLSYDPQEALESPVETTHVAGTTGTSRFPNKVLESVSRLFGRKVVAEADMEGAMVGIFLPKETAKKLHLKGGEPVEQLHITLLYFKDKAADRDDWDEVARITEQIANQTPALKGKISGYGMFQNDVDVLWASPSVQGLAELRHKLFEACEDAGFHVSTDHDWAPHITLKYDFKGKLPKIEEPIEFELDTLSFARGDNHKDFKFEGSFEKKAGDWGIAEHDYWAPHPESGDEQEYGPQTWSGWQGAHRFVTDGKEILTEPEEDLRADNKGWHGTGHPELEQKFKSFYPDAKGLVSGWVVPTSDEMGNGIFAPSAGFGGPHEPGLEDVMKIIDKHFDKPSHFVNDMALLQDSKMYKAYPEGGHQVGFPS